MSNRKNYTILIKEHYKKEAEEHGLASTSTMADLMTRRLEIVNISSYLKDEEKCLEVGCGNGSGSIEILKTKKIDLTCIDFSRDLITLAQKQSTKNIKGKIKFQERDILKLQDKNKYDCVFTERCIINLLNWNDQKKALKNIAGVLKKGGRLILLEAFKDGLDSLNKAREEIGLAAIPPAYHNLLLDKISVSKYLVSQGMRFVEENNFLSSHYFGSRILYPALAKAVSKEIIYNSTFADFFASLPPHGNFAHIKILIFKK
ncbi:MAG: class I SAM-dependent methyltransferase [Minisyncoccia bacterium]|jgi:ubiquinone/menaquinone biosynthesis C-methylase UbiE